uniref:MTAp n=1 Tax=Tetrahymena pyriformis TaxID=5908 RepID=A0A513X5A7_TETPY|nr:MTAp [Tetrahymena pyriformis]
MDPHIFKSNYQGVNITSDASIGNPNIKSFSQDQYYFYTDDSTSYSIKTYYKSQSPITNVSVSSFQQFSGFVYSGPQILESRTSVPSHLAVNFSVLSFTQNCAWLILIVPLDFTIGPQNPPLISMTDCAQNRYSIDLSTTSQSGNSVFYSSSSQQIFISCQTLIQSAVQSIGGGTQTPLQSLQCNNNTLTITQVESPKVLRQSQQLQTVIVEFDPTLPSTPNPPSPPLWYSPNLDATSFQPGYVFPLNEHQYQLQIPITQYFQPQQVSLVQSTSYQNDVSNFTLQFSLPVFMRANNHTLTVILPLTLILNREGDVSCTGNSTIFLLNPTNRQDSFPQISLTLKVTQNTSPSYSVFCQFYSAARYQTVNSISSLSQSSDPLQVIVYYLNEITSNTTTSVNMTNGLLQGPWIDFIPNQPLLISSNLVGKRGVDYTFSIVRVTVPNSIDPQNRIAIIQLDASLTLDPSFQCQILQSSNNQPFPCYQLQSNQIYFNSSIISSSGPQTLTITAIKNPQINLASVNQISSNLTFSFLYAWAQDIGLPNQTIYTIQNNTFTTPIQFSCSDSCSGCYSLYTNCTQCSSASPFIRINNSTNSISCLQSCGVLEVPVNSICTTCQATTQYCSSCSSSNLTSCSSCQSGYSYSSDWSECLDSAFFSKGSTRTLLKDISAKGPPTSLQNSEDQNSNKRITQQNDTMSGQSNLDSKTQGNSNSSQTSSLADSLKAITNGGRVVFAWAIGGAALICVGVKIAHVFQEKTKRKRDSQTDRRECLPPSEMNVIMFGQTDYRATALFLCLLSVVEVVEMPYILFWAYSASEGDLEHPVLQSLICVCSLSVILWIIDTSLLFSLLVNKQKTPITCSLFNPLPTSSRQNAGMMLQGLTTICRIIACLIPKSISLMLSNLCLCEGWTSFPCKEDEGRNSVLLTNFRKVLSSQIKSNATSIIAFITFFLLAYPAVLSSPALVYDIILFNVVMLGLCGINLRTADQILQRR